VWKLIQELKKGRVVVLTTHSMEEAEVLSDRVMVMVDGEIKCSGTCLFLKNHYGEGYKVEMIDENPHELWKFIEKNIKCAKFVDVSGNSLYVSIPRNNTEEVLKFFQIIENRKTKDWGIRNSSLEEVFMKVTGRLQDLGS
jgi:ABC-type multidrug transport system ATPase subunit